MSPAGSASAVILVLIAAQLYAAPPSPSGTVSPVVSRPAAKPQDAIETQPASDWPDSPQHRRVLASAEKSVAEAAPSVAQDRFRPGFHFTPPARFMNDPNGCIQHDGRYHMFYQHLPFWGRPNAPLTPGWGHAVSRDLVHWEHWPIALMPVPESYDAAAVASGCCVISDGLPTIIYTSVPPQAQSLARSFDGLRTWRRFARNPVIPSPPAIPDLEEGFRDPFVWREGERWRMLVGSAIRGRGGTVLMYESSDLVNWQFLGPLCTGMGPDCCQWECPNFFPLGDRWVLIVSPLFRSMPGLRGPVQYTVGRYDGRRFEHGDWHLLDLGGPGVFYAPNSLRDDQGRRILWGWLMGGGRAGVPWDGMLTLPRELKLGSDLRLRTWPAKEVDSLRAESLADIGRRELKPGEPLEVFTGPQFDAALELAPWGPGLLQIDLFCPKEGGAATTATFDLAGGELRCGPHVAVLPRNADDVCTLRFIADRSVVEAYADCREVVSWRVFPPESAHILRIAAERAPIPINRLRVWRMASIH